MDAATATIIVALITSGASIAVAVITTRNRIGVPQTSSEPWVAAAAPRSSSVRIFRGLGWALVVFLYLMSAVISVMFGEAIVYQNSNLAVGAFVVGAPCFLLRVGLTSVCGVATFDAVSATIRDTAVMLVGLPGRAKPAQPVERALQDKYRRHLVHD